MSWHLFSAFLVIAIVLFLTPGPIVTLVVTTGARSGVRAALTTVAGGVTGNALLLACIAFGLNWILQTSAEIFDFLRWIGAAYLVWLGIMAWRHAGAPDKASGPRGHVHAWRGLVGALTNPKTIAFFTAFLPQFIDPTLPVERQLLVMCVTSVAWRHSRQWLGDRGRPWPRVVHEAGADQVAQSRVRSRVDRRRPVAVARAAGKLAGLRYRAPAFSRTPPSP